MRWGRVGWSERVNGKGWRLCWFSSVKELTVGTRRGGERLGGLRRKDGGTSIDTMPVVVVGARPVSKYRVQGGEGKAGMKPGWKEREQQQQQRRRCSDASSKGPRSLDLNQESRCWETTSFLYKYVLDMDTSRVRRKERKKGEDGRNEMKRNRRVFWE
jgi:hypothetical protein